MVGSKFKKGFGLTSKHDLRDKNIVEGIFKYFNPKNIIHTAAKVGGLGANSTKQAEFLYDNIMINSNIIEACKKYDVERACFFLSTCVFPDKIDYPLTEEKIHLGPSHPSNYGYSMAKRVMETLVKAYNEQYNTKYFCVIPCNVYGPGDNFSLADGHVIPMLIHKCYIARETNTPFEVWGDGSALREFIFAKDLANITEKLMYETDFKGNIIVSNPEEYSIKQIVNNITHLMNFKGEIKWLTDKSNGQHRKPSSIEKLESILDKQNFTEMTEGLTETIKWFEENYPNIRK